MDAVPWFMAKAVAGLITLAVFGGGSGAAMYGLYRVMAWAFYRGDRDGRARLGYIYFGSWFVLAWQIAFTVARLVWETPRGDW